ncbi:MAG: FAD-dependent thymidylate synthase [Patescibacteria group bacterium]|nr:FAD-dependent thymidylate synthase [Patescibacteria group bacterium]
MKAIKAYFVIEDHVDGERFLRSLEKYGRVCYKSESKITVDSAKRLISNILKNQHESVIEHEKVTVRVICDRGVTHEIVRHRLGSYSQESTRYCDYAKAGEILYIEPIFWATDDPRYLIWKETMGYCEASYNKLIKLGATPQEARSVLPNSLKTEIVITYNLREWRHFFKLRSSKKAHPQMREIAVPLLAEFKKMIPIIFDDIFVES